MKKCSVCKDTKDFVKFSKNSKKKDGLQTSCKTCNSVSSKKYYEDNTEKHKQVNALRTNQAKVAARDFALQHLKQHPCIDCGNSDYRVLDFDHVRGVKVANINSLISGGYSIQKLADEIEKCEIRCKNCHAIATYVRLGSLDWRSKAMILLDT